MKKLLPLLLGLLTLLSTQAQTAQEAEDEAWRLREMSEGKARRTARGLELATAGGWKKPNNKSGDWIWVALRANGQFHELRRYSSAGRVTWAWVSRRSGRLTHFPVEPVAWQDGGFLVLPDQHAATPVQLQAWESHRGELRAINFGEVIGLQGHTDLFFDRKMTLQTSRDGIQVSLQLIHDGRNLSVVQVYPPIWAH